MKNSRKLGVVAAMVAVVTLGIAAPAQAAQGKELGAKSCTEGSAATTARATGSQQHRANNDYKTFPGSGATYVTRTWYTGLKSVSSSRVDVGGSLSSASIFCDV